MGLDLSSQLEDSAFMFDAVWAAALALNNTIMGLEDFTYDSGNSVNISQKIYRTMLDLDFLGLTVSYNCHTSQHHLTHYYLDIATYSS